ncbi:disease resistance protein RPV1-like [Carya illinoinensis]|uniref:disease resistance protein RPV1-like n=1 Tax=Carya illinoinensis TaxID=32201 RepID=UPI001C71AE61|nr:disease resistance protein RPV1-like [Carya illinoinensis]
MNTQRVSSSSSSPPVRKYDVFLSFHGKDTRLGFTGHLYDALRQKGIIAFRDDEKLERGEFVSSGLLKAIEESEYAVIILSPNFASSRWCLIELAKIVRCRKDMGLVVMPVFYHVDPSHVRHQSGTFAEALAKHEQNSKIVKEDVQTWRAALRELGEISGWHIKLQEGHEPMFIKHIVARIYRKRKIQRQSIFSHGIVGIKFRETETMKLLDIGLDDVRFIGFYGIDGVGKTTLAEIIYDRIADQFEASSFIYRVSEETQRHGVVYLQRKILSDILMEREIINGLDDRKVYNEIRDRLRSIRVLIILDDVNENKQLESLAGSPEWFGRGSRVIVTSKDKQVLNSHGVRIIYTVKELGDDEALQLFCQNAFKEPHPVDNYVDLSKDFVNYAKGLPGTLKVLGTFLYDKGIDEWKQVRDQLKENPDRDILEMHGLLRKMHQERILHESNEEPDQESRIWVFEDVLLGLKNNTGAADVRRIVLDIPPQQEEHLRFVWIGIIKENVFFAPVLETPDLRVIVQKVFSHKGDLDQVPEFQSDEYAIKQLRQLLRQIGGPISLILDDDVLSGSESLLEKFELRMPNCNILATSGSKAPRYSFIYNLKSLNDEGAMTLCCHSATPQDGSSLSPDEKIVKKDWPAWLCESIHLKKLSIDNCHKLSVLPEEIGNLNNLEELRLMSCTVLSKLPDTIGLLHRLHILDISHCPALLNLPDTIGMLQGLHTLRISHCAIFSSLPDTVGMLSGLHFLEISYCTSLSNLPVTIGELRELQILHMSYCSALKSLPDTVGMLLGLRILCISCCSVFSNLPETIGRLHNLQILGISSCPTLSDLPETIGMLQGLRILGISGCPSMSALPDTIGMLQGLSILGVSHCSALSNLPVTIGMLSGLRILGISHCPALSDLPETIGRLHGLSIIGVSHCSALLNLPVTIGNLIGLRILGISHCLALSNLPETIGMLSGLRILSVSHCPAFSNFPGTIRRLRGLQILDISYCPVLSNLPETIGMLHELRILDMSH